MKGKILAGTVGIVVLVGGVSTFASSGSSSLPTENEGVGEEALQENGVRNNTDYIIEKYDIEPVVEKLDGKERTTLSIEDPKVIKELVEEGIVEMPDGEIPIKIEIVDIVYDVLAQNN